MNNTPSELWDRFKKYYCNFADLGLTLDISRMRFPNDYFSSMTTKIESAFDAMEALEAGAIANPDENRMVGHYWLRDSGLAPGPEIKSEIDSTIASIKDFAGKVHSGEISGSQGSFKNLLIIGIGGSALGPQFVAQALGHPREDRLSPYFFDNTDPDGMERVLAKIGEDLGRTITLVISKSGGTKETRNGMLEATNAFQRSGIDFSKHAVAITGDGSQLDEHAKREGWLARFPMWDWVGGRTSETSAVGLLPAALQGIDIDQFLAGAKTCDTQTRTRDALKNPAALLALMWHYAGNGIGDKSMVILPYKDRLELFSRYLQQLLMESLGKAHDLDGNLVNQGIAVYGNKGSTDQHAYVQQLRDGRNDFFVTFIEVLKDREGEELFVEPNITSGDYLSGFYLGTRQALYEGSRESMTITIDEISPFSVGVLIALYERAVGLYASLININAYHQPGVEGGKRAAGEIIRLQGKVVEVLEAVPGTELLVEQITARMEGDKSSEAVFKICEHLAANPSRRVIKTEGTAPADCKYRISPAT